MNKYKESLENSCSIVLGIVVFLYLISVYLYNTRLKVANGNTVAVFLEEKVRNLNKVKNVRFTGIDCYEIRRTDKARRQAQRMGITVEETVNIGKESNKILSDSLNRDKDERKYLPHYDGLGRILGTLYTKNLNITEYKMSERR